MQEKKKEKRRLQEQMRRKKNDEKRQKSAAKEQEKTKEKEQTTPADLTVSPNKVKLSEIPLTECFFYDYRLKIVWNLQYFITD